MKDFIFIIGPSGVGKTTLAKGLFKHYNGVYFEQNMVPEFGIPKNCADEGLFEEIICFDNAILQLKYFYKKGFRNIIALDFDDLRARELPKIFKGYNFITIKLISSDSKQIKNQMISRHNNEGGLFDIENVEKSNEKIKNRKLLPNEVEIDIFGKNAKDVLNEAINLIDNFKPLIKYNYKLDNKKNYNSWIKSNNLK